MFNKYEKYILTSPNRVSSLKDLKEFGLLNIPNYLEQEYIYLPYINNIEKDFVSPIDWQYKINKYNFRESWDFQSNNKKIGFFGCSFTFGEGVNYNYTFCNLVAKKLNLNPFNFGVGGSSVHRITITFSAVIKLIKLNYAVFTLPNWRRQMHVKSNGKIVNLIPHWPDSEFVNLNKTLTELEEDYYIVQTISFLSWINDLSKANQIKIILSSWDSELNELCKTLYPDLTINKFCILDKARDNSHPGIKSHENYANQIINAI